MSSPDVAERVRRLGDRAAINDLAVRYCMAIDDGDCAGMVDMYTDKSTHGGTTTTPSADRLVSGQFRASLVSCS